MDMIVQGWSMSLFQATQQKARICRLVTAQGSYELNPSQVSIRQWQKQITAAREIFDSWFYVFTNKGDFEPFLSLYNTEFMIASQCRNFENKTRPVTIGLLEKI